MTLEDVVRELLQYLGDEGDRVVPWEQIRRWPKEPVDAFQGAGWLQSGDLAETVECPGCEESYLMPVETFPADDGQGVRAFVACEDRNFGRVKIPPVRLQQWRFGLGQLARWIADTLALRFSGKRLDGGRLLELGLAGGDKRAQMLCLHTPGGLALAAGSNRIPLVDAIQRIDGALTLDADLIGQYACPVGSGYFYGWFRGRQAVQQVVNCFSQTPRETWTCATRQTAGAGASELCKLHVVST